MKIGIVGCGFVGATTAYALVMRGIGSEIVLVDKNTERAKAEAEDISHAVPFSNPMRVSYGSFKNLEGCKSVIITAGVNQKPGETRFELLSRNAVIFREIIPEILENAPDSILIVATNPVDVLTHITAEMAEEKGIPKGKVIGSGTTLDTARFRTLLGYNLEIDPQHVHSYVIGEHGDSETLTWSIVSIGGIPLNDFCRERSIKLSESVKESIDNSVRCSAYNIIKGKGATYYGIGSALARIVDVILNDKRAILTICSLQAEVESIPGVTLSLPHLVGENGIIASIPLSLNSRERESLRKSAETIKKVINSLKN